MFGMCLSHGGLCGLRSEATRTILPFFRRAEWRSLESDANSNIWLKGTDKDRGSGFFFRTQVRGGALTRGVTATAAGSGSAAPQPGETSGC